MIILTIQVNLVINTNFYEVFLLFRGGFRFCKQGAVSNIYSLNMYFSLSNLFVIPE